MKFKQQNITIKGLDSIVIVSYLNIFFLLMTFSILLTHFISQPVISVKLPKAITSDTITQKNFTITISDENVIYFDSSVLTLNEVEVKLKKSTRENRPILIKADSRASISRIIDVWNICRKLGIEKINIATNRSEL